MSYLVLARKYRPQTFDDVVEQSHVTRTLKNAIAAGRVAHAILFSGPRGTGKTTVARILAKAMCCADGPTPDPCGQCQACREIAGGSAADVFEIDGASNNGVDQVRELRENLKYLPVHTRYKIYIIDEVHMLSTAAFNALLKTLEEPPAHVLFFFATTEPQKIPVTILSRCQRHDLRRISADSVVGHMAALCDQEGVPVDSESLALIARSGDGSMRDALSLLDQIISCADGEVTPQSVIDVLGVVDRSVLFTISSAVGAGDLPTILAAIEAVHDRGQSLKALYAQLVEHFRNLLMVKIGGRVEGIVDVPADERARLADAAAGTSELHLSQVLDALLKAEGAIKFSARPRIALEMACIRICRLQPPLPIETLIERIDRLREAGPAAATTAPPRPAPEPPRPAPPPRAEPSSPEPPANPVEAPPSNTAPGVAESPPPPMAAPPSKNPDGAWDRFVAAVSERSAALGACLSRCSLSTIDDQRIQIAVSGNGFNKKRIQKNLGGLRDACQACFGTPLEVVLTDGEAETTPRQRIQQTEARRQEALDHPLVNTALTLFDGQVVDVTILPESD